LTGTGLLVSIAGWVGYAVVLALCARALFTWHANQALALVSGGVVALLTANTLFLREIAAGNRQPGGVASLGVLALGGVCGAAALTPSMTAVASADPAEHGLGPLRLTILAVALLLAPAVLLVQATSRGVATDVAIALTSGAVGVVVLIRIWASARLYRRRLARFDAVRTASYALLSATTERDVVESITAALSAMLPLGKDHRVRLVAEPPDVEGQPRARLWRMDDRKASGDIGELTVRWPTGATPTKVARQQPWRDQPGLLWADEPAPSWLREPDSAPDDGPPNTLVYTAPTSELLELWSALLALSDLAGSAMQRIRLVAALASEERESYFRTLVMTSTDVTLISRRGRIDYATPSSFDMFGRDVRGEAFDGLVHRQPLPDHQDEPWSDTVDGDDGYVFRPDGGSDIVVMHRRDLADDPTIRGVVSTLRNVTRERVLQQDLAYRASHDALTGLANVELFDREMRSAAHHGVDRRRGAGSAAGRAAIFVDLDDFKAVNDTYGHEIGDRVLVYAARRIESCLRPEDVAARIGGDEFAVLLRDLPDVATAGSIAQRIVDALGGGVTTEDTGSAGCQASVGVAYAAGPIDPDLLLRRADVALYTAKAQGKGKWRLYEERTADHDGER
jgi:diguanylate cyclase (GGDEF)-like protein